MRTTVYCLILLFLIGVVACRGHDATHDEAHDGGGLDTAGHAEHESGAATASSHGLGLNGREKWQMDEHTRTVFAKMAGRLDGMTVDDAAAAPDTWKQTGTVLKQDISELIAGCTMQGPAHDELHKFLTLYIPAVNELAASGAAQSATEVHELLEVYPDYFE